MTKTFAQAPKPKPPTPEAITAFERGGAGQDTQRHKPTDVGMKEGGKPNDEPLRRLSIDLPESLHRRFKTACAKADLKMQIEVIGMIARRTGDLEKER